jgi:hypothetical protein
LGDDYLKNDSLQVEWMIGFFNENTVIREVTPSSPKSPNGRGHPEKNRIIIGG